MNIKHLMKTSLFTGVVFLSSCAYMQTHKNIEEHFREHTGYQLSPDIQLYRAGENYYLGVEKQQLRIHYPAIYDSVFLSHDNEPELTPISNTSTRVYRRISDGTAAVLQRTDGYADLGVISDELRHASTPWEPSLPGGARACCIKAEIAGTTTTWAEEGSATEAPASIRLLSAADRVLIDWPGTLLYNIAIPVMAPFVFFHEFLNEQ